MNRQLASHLGVGVGDVEKRRLSPTHDERQAVVLRIEDDAFQRQLFQKAVETLLAVFAQQMDERRVERVLQGLVGRHCAPILATVVLRRETRKAHRDVGHDHLRQKCTFVEHGSEKERLEYAAR